MVVGFYTRYQPRELTRYILILADWLEQRRVSVSILAQGKPCEVDPAWDKSVISGVKFTDWAKKCSTIVWTHLPTSGQVEWARKQKISCIFLISWSELALTEMHRYEAFDKVVSPSRIVSELLVKTYDLESVVTIPPYPNLAITTNAGRPISANVRLLFPMYDHKTDRIQTETLLSMGRILDAIPDAAISVVCTKLCGKARREASSLRSEFGSRFDYYGNLTYGELALACLNHDLTVWTSGQEDFGLVGITSLYMGTPVIGFNVLPISEIIKHGKNGLLIDTNVMTEASSARRANTHLGRLEKVVMTLASKPECVAELQANTYDGLDSRRKTFDASWFRLFRLSKI